MFSASHAESLTISKVLLLKSNSFHDSVSDCVVFPKKINNPNWWGRVTVFPRKRGNLDVKGNTHFPDWNWRIFAMVKLSNNNCSLGTIDHSTSSSISSNTRCETKKNFQCGRVELAPQSKQTSKAESHTSNVQGQQQHLVLFKVVFFENMNCGKERRVRPSRSKCMRIRFCYQLRTCKKSNWKSVSGQPSTWLATSLNMTLGFVAVTESQQSWKMQTHFCKNTSVRRLK